MAKQEIDAYRSGYDEFRIMVISDLKKILQL